MSRYIDREEAEDLADRSCHDSSFISAYEANRRRDIRVAKGRPKFRYLTRQYRRDSKHYPPCDTVAPDPILDLLVFRNGLLRDPTDQRAQERYWKVRHDVTAPLPTNRTLP